MALSDFMAKLKEKRSFIEGSQQNLPVGGQGATLEAVFDRFLDSNNCRQLSYLNRQERGVAAILDAYAHANNEYDIDSFLLTLTENMFILSASEDGHRSNQLQNIAVGQMNRDFAVEMAEIRSGGQNKELKDAI